jgi:NAD(P)-dependent dehydrogenase (short-subunit alcohol dehydrogenase family)
MNGQTRRRLLVTGATGGMGRVCAEQAAGQAYDLVLADLSADRLQELAARCEQQGAACECHPLDVTRAESVGDLVAALTSQPVDAIIHTVGVSPQMAGWEQIVDIDLIGSVALLEAVRPHLSPQGCVVVIASMSAHMVPPDQEIDKALAQAYESGDIEPLKGIAALANSGMAYAYAKRALKQYVADRAQEGKTHDSYRYHPA